MNNDLSINVHDVVNISESFRLETEIDAIIYRQEFEKYHQSYQTTKSENDLIFCFIFLQMYIECFLHQNMRRIIRLEFKPPRDYVCERWSEGQAEKRHISEKVKSFPTLFFAPILIEIQNPVDLIALRLKRIAYPRNQFVHGHKVASWFDLEKGRGDTDARSLLTGERLMQSLTEANELGDAWNDLLYKILPQCKSARDVNDFQFSLLTL